MFTFSGSSVVDTCANLHLSPEANSLAANYGLAVQHVQWEDTSRYQNSSWGDNITDMTLRVSGKNMPAIRPPNFEDLTWDEPFRNINVVVGNESSGSPTRTISLENYLRNINSYLSNVGGTFQNSLFSQEKDTNVLMSSQSCFLPVVPQSKQVLRGDTPPSKTEFYPTMFTYGNYDASDPKVLYILATSQGTSAQIREAPPPGENLSSGQSVLYFNKQGEKAPLEAMSLVAERIIKNHGRDDVPGIYDINMNEKEKERNIVMVIQVPLLKRQSAPRSGMPSYSMKKMSPSFGARETSFSFGAAPVAQMDNAVISVGTSRGSFKGLSEQPKSLVRDAGKPVRITLQFYKTTETGVISDSDMKFISDQIKNSRKNGVAFGSLVTGLELPIITPPEPLVIPQPFVRGSGTSDWGWGNFPGTGRTTRTTQTSDFFRAPPFWWDSVWKHVTHFTPIVKGKAERLLFSEPTYQIFAGITDYGEARTKVLAALKSLGELYPGVELEGGPPARPFSFEASEGKR